MGVKWPDHFIRGNASLKRASKIVFIPESQMEWNINGFHSCIRINEEALVHVNFDLMAGDDVEAHHSIAGAQ